MHFLIGFFQRNFLTLDMNCCNCHKTTQKSPLITVLKYILKDEGYLHFYIGLFVVSIWLLGRQITDRL